MPQATILIHRSHERRTLHEADVIKDNLVKIVTQDLQRSPVLGQEHVGITIVGITMIFRDDTQQTVLAITHVNRVRYAPDADSTIQP